MSDFSKYKTTYESFPKITVKLLWHSGFWDGPLSGMCLFNGEKYWFKCIEDWWDTHTIPDDEKEECEEQLWSRRYLVWKLDPEQQAIIESGHLKFQTMVGTHTDYDDKGQRSFFRLNDSITQKTVDQYYEEAKLEKSFNLIITDESIIGWYER